MRAAVLCVLLALFAHKVESRAANDDDFRPTPIPLKDWRPVRQDAAGTLHEIINTETPSTIAAVPAHYWEDALRHSVYLTLVRDKIDQLIAKGTAISSEGNSNRPSKDDDHDLWEKIKSAPFDRLNEDASPTGDLSILAKGRLVEENDGYRFAEDEAVSRNNCGGDNCTKDVKAFWSVKRVRQRDAEPSTGKYHYELTFSVTSQTPQKLKKPFENPARTFTVKENAPIDFPPVYRPYDSFHRQPSRPQRAIWVHKNIAPVHNYRVRQSTSDLDRIFTSLFSDEDSQELPRYKQNTYVPQPYPQFSKVGYVGSRETYHQQKMIPFPAQFPLQYSRPSLQVYSSPPHIQKPYFNIEPHVNSPPITPHAENTFASNVVKTTRPPVLPTPVEPFSLIKESTVETPVINIFNKTDYFKPNEAISTYKMYKPKQPATKISYTPEHVRPPVYNAPPGVFVTMDKKPFKPMPSLKLAHPKPVKHLPQDFRPSPQVLDAQFSNPDSVPDTAFRPISLNSDEDVYNRKVIVDGKKGNKNIQKMTHGKKPPKKQDSIKPHRRTTIAPDIITAHDDDDIDIEWTSLFGAFSKTTPMASQKEKATTTESTTVAATTIDPMTTAETDSEETEPEYILTTPILTTTTPLPKKRTRPPPIFKQEKKVKKHKRVTTTTTTESPEKSTVPKPTEDLTPQASSAPTSGANSVWETRNKTESILTTSTTAKATLTTTRPTTTTYLTTSSTTLSTTVKTEAPVVITQLRSKNRFRQSTLMQKGTSVNHDKWYMPTLEKTRTTSHSDKIYLRRKASKFHGYNSSTPRTVDEESNKDNHEDNVANSKSEMKSTESYKGDTTTNTITRSTQTDIDEYTENNETTTDSIHTQTEIRVNNEESEDNDNSNDARAYKDEGEFIFQVKSTTPENESTVTDTSDNALTMQPTTVTSHAEVKNKTRCKKKKHNNISTTEETPKTTSDVFDTTTLTEMVTTPGILEELFGGFTMDGNENDEPEPSTSTTDLDPEVSQSIKHERFIGDDSVDRFLESLEVKGNYQTENDEQTDKDYVESSDVSIEAAPYNSDDDEDDDDEARYDDYYENHDSHDSRPYSLLELMAME